MNCREFWETMPELQSALSDAGPGHARDCPACAALLEHQRTLAEGLRAVAADSRRVEAPPRLERRLATAFRAHNGLAAAPRGAWVPVLTWVAAAAAVFTLAVFLVRERQPQPAQRRVPNRMELASLQFSQDLQAVEDTVYSESGFIPLPNAERIGVNDDLNLVRVELPRSSMIALGFAVSAERAAEPVEADVVLGPDGLARAVRFLDE